MEEAAKNNLAHILTIFRSPTSFLGIIHQNRYWYVYFRTGFRPFIAVVPMEGVFGGKVSSFISSGFAG